MKLKDLQPGDWFYIPGTRRKDSGQKMETQPHPNKVRVMVVTKAGTQRTRNLNPNLDVEVVPKE